VRCLIHHAQERSDEVYEVEGSWSLRKGLQGSINIIELEVCCVHGVNDFFDCLGAASSSLDSWSRDSRPLELGV
jgi:hypothetical protein